MQNLTAFLVFPIFRQSVGNVKNIFVWRGRREEKNETKLGNMKDKKVVEKVLIMSHDKAKLQEFNIDSSFVGGFWIKFAFNL